MNSTSADFQNLYQALSHSAARSPDALALAFEDRRYLYRDFHLRVQRAMAQLDRGWSLRKGDRILLAWGNHPAFCEVLFAALGLGIEVVPFSTKLKQAESEALVGHIAPRVVLFDATVQDWLKNTPDARAVSLSEWQALCLPEPLTRPPVPVNRDDTAVMMFTSGTTGEPKGAIITHNNLLCAIDAYTQKLNLTAADSTILAVPIYHITGLSALLALFISLGASIWLQHRFNAPQVITTLREQNITFLHGSPTIFILLCQAAREQSASHPGDFPALRTIACGAGHLSDGLIKELKTLFPHTAIQPIYGLTETTSPATIFPGDVWGSDKCGSSGQAIPGLAITIRNDRQQPLPAGQIGHIWLKGDVVIREYWQHSERRPSCDAQGWFCTGDLGYLDDEGWLYIKDRSKDMINRGGEKIYSLELENILSTYRGVREVAVIPTPSPVYGEEPVAFIVPDGQHHLTSEEILDWLKVKIARFKLPARIIFTRALPRTHNGKVSKQQLKTRLAPAAQNAPLPLDLRKLIGRIACRYLTPGCVINLGTGIPNDVIGAIIHEEQLGEQVTITVESGIYGGQQAGGVDFGIGRNLSAMISHQDQMLYYNGAGVDITFMGAGEMDPHGHVNATRLGASCPGAGGFIDITQNARHVVFCSSFTAKGLEIACEHGALHIRREGEVRKFVAGVNQISYNGELARAKGQTMHYVTERAVFELRPEGPVLTEIAPGIDLERDILAQMDFHPAIAADLQVMDSRLFAPPPCGLAEHLSRNSSSDS